MKILHCADLHLGLTSHSANRIDPVSGLNVRLADFAARLQDLCNAALAGRYDVVLLAGDAFAMRTPDASALRVLAEALKKLSDAGVPVVAVTGNHDTAAVAGRAHALSIFQTLGLPGLTILDRPAVLQIETRSGPLCVAGLPWPAKGWLTAYAAGASLAEKDALLGAYLQQELGRLAHETRFMRGEAERPLPAVLLAHLGVVEAEASGEAGLMAGREVQLPLAAFRAHADAFDYVALGHYHRFQGWPAQAGAEEAPWIAYAGSLERVDFGEAQEPKGWVSVELDGAGGRAVEHVCGWRTQARAFVTIAADCRAAPDPTAAVVRAALAAGPLAGKIVRLCVQLRPEQAQALREADVARVLAEAWFVAPVVKEIEYPQRLRLGADAAEVAALTPVQALARYLGLQQGLTSDRRRALQAAGEQLMAELDAA